jgi:hypothetical protein
MRVILVSGVVMVAALLTAGCGGGGEITGISGTTLGPSTRTTRTLPAATRTEAATTTVATPAPTTTQVVTQPATTQVVTHASTVTVTAPARTTTQVVTTTQPAPTATTTSGVNTTAVVVGGAAAAASQSEEPESTPWGWIAFAILAAGVLGAAIFWLVKGDRGHDSTTPGGGAGA